MMIEFSFAGIPMKAFNLIRFMEVQAPFSQKTFGPGTRLKGVLQHIRKELVEIEDKPEDCEEWCDVLILTLDGALRQGHSPEHICQTLEAKLKKNMARKWRKRPDWQTMSQDEAITHVKDSAEMELDSVEEDAVLESFHSGDGGFKF